MALMNFSLYDVNAEISFDARFLFPAVTMRAAIILRFGKSTARSASRKGSEKDG
jgi:hypothetical protein